MNASQKPTKTRNDIQVYQIFVYLFGFPFLPEHLNCSIKNFCFLEKNSKTNISLSKF